MEYSPELRDAIVDYIKNGVPVKQTCDAVGIAKSTFYEWKKNHPDFSDAIKSVEANRIKCLVSAIQEAGFGGKLVECPECGHEFTVSLPQKQWQALAWILERGFYNEFGVKKQIDANITKRPVDIMAKLAESGELDDE